MPLHSLDAQLKTQPLFYLRTRSDLPQLRNSNQLELETLVSGDRRLVSTCNTTRLCVQRLRFLTSWLTDGQTQMRFEQFNDYLNYSLAS